MKIYCKNYILFFFYIFNSVNISLYFLYYLSISKIMLNIKYNKSKKNQKIKIKKINLIII